MKTLLLFLSFLLFNSFLSFAAEKPNPVLDSDGEELRAGVEYHVVSSIRGAGGGGVTYGFRPGNYTCPLAVVQEKLDVRRGYPVTFTPVNPEDDVVRVSTDLNIKFANAAKICIQSNVWTLDFNEELGQHFIVTNGVEGNSGCGTWTNWFRIEGPIAGSSYKLIFCPSVCDIIEVTCRDVGLFFGQDSARRLALSDSPFWVTFSKAHSTKNENILKSVTST